MLGIGIGGQGVLPCLALGKPVGAQGSFLHALGLVALAAQIIVRSLAIAKDLQGQVCHGSSTDVEAGELHGAVRHSHTVCLIDNHVIQQQSNLAFTDNQFKIQRILAGLTDLYPVVPVILVCLGHDNDLVIAGRQLLQRNEVFIAGICRNEDSRLTPCAGIGQGQLAAYAVVGCANHQAATSQIVHLMLGIGIGGQSVSALFLGKPVLGHADGHAIIHSLLTHRNAVVGGGQNAVEGEDTHNALGIMEAFCIVQSQLAVDEEIVCAAVTDQLQLDGIAAAKGHAGHLCGYRAAPIVATAGGLIDHTHMGCRQLGIHIHKEFDHFRSAVDQQAKLGPVIIVQHLGHIDLGLKAELVRKHIVQIGILGRAAGNGHGRCAALILGQVHAIGSAIADAITLCIAKLLALIALCFGQQRILCIQVSLGGGHSISGNSKAGVEAEDTSHGLTCKAANAGHYITAVHKQVQTLSVLQDAQGHSFAIVGESHALYRHRLGMVPIVLAIGVGHVAHHRSVHSAVHIHIEILTHIIALGEEAKLGPVFANGYIIGVEFCFKIEVLFRKTIDITKGNSIGRYSDLILGRQIQLGIHISKEMAEDVVQTPGCHLCFIGSAQCLHCILLGLIIACPGCIDSLQGLLHAGRLHLGFDHPVTYAHKGIGFQNRFAATGSQDVLDPGGESAVSQSLLGGVGFFCAAVDAEAKADFGDSGAIALQLCFESQSVLGRIQADMGDLQSQIIAAPGRSHSHGRDQRQHHRQGQKQSQYSVLHLSSPLNYSLLPYTSISQMLAQAPPVVDSTVTRIYLACACWLMVTSTRACASGSVYTFHTSPSTETSILKFQSDFCSKNR